MVSLLKTVIYSCSDVAKFSSSLTPMVSVLRYGETCLQPAKSSASPDGLIKSLDSESCYTSAVSNGLEDSTFSISQDGYTVRMRLSRIHSRSGYQDCTQADAQIQDSREGSCQELVGPPIPVTESAKSSGHQIRTIRRPA